MIISAHPEGSKTTSARINGSKMSSKPIKGQNGLHGHKVKKLFVKA